MDLSRRSRPPETAARTAKTDSHLDKRDKNGTQDSNGARGAARLRDVAVNGAALIGLFYAERNREYPLPAAAMTVGRAAENHLRIRDDRVADHHIRVRRKLDEHVLDVLSGDAATLLNGTELEPGAEKPLAQDDIITLGPLEFRYVRDRSLGVLARLWVVRGIHRGKVFRIAGPNVAIGRATDNDVQIPDHTVSRHHCRLCCQPDGWWIEDLESTNGTVLRATRLERPRRVHHGDEIAAGYSRFVFEDGER